MNGKFYGVGVGPGDPMLITYKAVETIKNSDIIVVPNSGASENIALKIAKEHIIGKKIVECDMPMTRDEKKLEEYHNNATNFISEFLDDGKIVSFLTLGDPTIYSSVMYVHKRLTKKGHDTALIPGVTSFCAAAASLNTSLCEKNELLHIIPASYKDTDTALSLKGNKALMKCGKSIADIKEKLIKTDKNAMMVECASMENEKIHQNLNSVDENASYFSLIIVKENEDKI
jgi:precorrin-2/cobalt-factor-2 C20-methyltransferase